MRPAAEIGSGAVQANDVIQQGAGRRLAALVEPPARQHGTQVRPPDTTHRPWSRRKRHVAGGRAGDQAEPPVERRGTTGGPRTHDAQGAGMRVDQPGADPASGGQAEMGGGFGQEWPEVAADGTARAGRAPRTIRSPSPMPAKKSCCQPGVSWAR